MKVAYGLDVSLTLPKTWLYRAASQAQAEIEK